MSDGRRVIPCRSRSELSVDYFGHEDSEPISLFENFQSEIEDSASDKFEIGGIINGIIEIKESDLI